jgi:hypothetical protein
LQRWPLGVLGITALLGWAERLNAIKDLVW